VDISVMLFFWSMFALSVVFACTDVAVDRATVIAGDAESRASGRSKAAAVGLNQSICWAAIYGTSIVSAATGGLIADRLPIRLLLIGLAAVPLVVLLVVLRLPRDTARPVPLAESVSAFWNGLNTGPILWIVLFYFLFHFQPAMGALWTNYLIEEIKFTQTQIGYADGVAYAGFFLGVLLFARFGVRWQDRYGLRNVFRGFILLSMAVSFTQYLMVEPHFSRIAEALHTALPGSNPGTVRWAYYAAYSFAMSVVVSFIRMSTFSLVGAIIPVRAAGSLFAGFMSVANLAYSFSYASGSWLYTHGLEHGMLRGLQAALFGLPAEPGAKMSISLLIFIGSAAYLLSLLVAHVLPDARHTRSAEDISDGMVGPDQHRTLGTATLRRVGLAALALGIALLALQVWAWGRDPIASAILAFLAAAFARKIALDRRYLRQRRGAPQPRLDAH
jgi:MFS family permease